MKRVYRTIEEQVEKCYPKATKEEKAILVERYREMLKGQPIMEWVPESEEEARQMLEYQQFHIRHVLMQMEIMEQEKKHWQTVKQRQQQQPTTACSTE